jgi:hypothetical protein
VTEQRLAISTAALVHIDIPADCVRARSITQCLQQIAQVATNGSDQAPPAPATPAAQ